MLSEVLSRPRPPAPTCRCTHAALCASNLFNLTEGDRWQLCLALPHLTPQVSIPAWRNINNNYGTEFYAETPPMSPFPILHAVSYEDCNFVLLQVSVTARSTALSKRRSGAVQGIVAKLERGCPDLDDIQREIILEAVFAVATSDGQMADQELLQRVAAALSVPPAVVDLKLFEWRVQHPRRL